jgi:hypothetical protein
MLRLGTFSTIVAFCIFASVGYARALERVGLARQAIETLPYTPSTPPNNKFRGPGDHMS